MWSSPGGQEAWYSVAWRLAFVGDGGANQGTFLESLNLASIWSLPCVFVIENNGYAEATSVKYAGACHDFADRANGFGMPGVTVDGTTFRRVRDRQRGNPRARKGGGPSLIECKVIRYYRPLRRRHAILSGSE